MTQSNPSTTEQPENNTAALVRRAYRTATIILVAAISIVLFYLFLAWQLNAWQLYVLAGVIAAFTVANFVAMRLIHRGQINTGAWIIIIGMYVVFPVAVFLVADIGLIFGFLVPLLTFVVASQSLPGNQTRRATTIGIGIGIVTALIDFLPLDYRLSVPIIRTFIPAISAVIVLVAGFFVIRRAWAGNLRLKMITSFTIVVLLATAAIATFTAIRTRTVLLADAFEKLQAVEAIKVSELANYFDERKDDVQVLAQIADTLLGEGIEKLSVITDLKASKIVSLFQDWDADVQFMAADPEVVNGMRDLTTGFAALGDSEARRLYLGKSESENARDGSDYSAAHQELHVLFTQYIETQGFIDAFLIDSAGNIIYSVRKGGSFGARLTEDEYQNSNLTGLYQQLKNAEAGQTYLADVRLFDDEKALFIGSPIYHNRSFLGVLAYQLPLDEINAIVQNRSGLGETGETYLVGKVGNQNQLRSDRVVKAGNYIGAPKPGDDADQALAGTSGEAYKVGSTGVYEISEFSPLAIETPGLNWAILTTMSVEELMVPLVEGTALDLIAEFKETFGYYDVFLISPDGYIFYTVEHEPDYLTNILTGPYSDSNLSELVADVLENKPSVQIVDFEPYAPSQDAPAGFFAAPVLHEEETVLVVAAQISLEAINNLLHERTGLGESGETYVVGQDNLMHTDSRFLDQLGVETTILNEDWPVDTVATRSALAGGTGTEVIADYRGVNVLSSWSPLVLREPDEDHPEGIVWAFMAEIDEAEALQPAVTQTRLILLLSLVIVGLSIAGAYGLAQVLANPIIQLTNAAQEIAAGDLTAQAEVTAKDEIGFLAAAFNTMTAQLRETLEGLEQQVTDRTRALETSTEVSRRLSTILDQDTLVREVVEQLTTAFNYYHAHIYLFDERKENLVMVGGTGDAGRSMLASGHKLEPGRGLVGRAAQTNQTVLIPDVSQAEGWLPNPLLPDTKAEVAVPIAIGGEVLGVLDVQHNIIGGLSDEDASLIQSIANQVGIAVQNAQTYQRTQQQAVREARITAINQRIQSAMSIDDVLQIAVSELGQALDANQADIELSMIAKQNRDSATRK